MIYEREGIGALSNPSLSSRGNLYSSLYRHGLGQKRLLKELHLADEWKRYKLGIPIRRNGRETLLGTWERAVAADREIAERKGSLPPAPWMLANGYAWRMQPSKRAVTATASAISSRVLP